MKTVILAGGFGTRLGEETKAIPKPMVEIGGKPILWHIMRHYASFGMTEFVIALGYKANIVKDYFLNFYAHNGDVTIDLATGNTCLHGPRHTPWKVHLVDTGLHTQTGGRLKRLRHWIGDEPFMATYGDGVSDIDLSSLLAFHRSSGRVATVSAVHPPARFGDLQLAKIEVARFAEKPQATEGWINGGFFVFEPTLFDYIDGDQIALEREPLEALVDKGQLAAYRHDGFWQMMDTPRDRQLLEELWSSGEARWSRGGGCPISGLAA